MNVWKVRDERMTAAGLVFKIPAPCLAMIEDLEWDSKANFHKALVTDLMVTVIEERTLRPTPR